MLVPPDAFVTVSVMIFHPILLKVNDGFCRVEVPSSWNIHDHEVTGPVEWSVNCTVNGMSPVGGDQEKAAFTGAVAIT